MIQRHVNILEILGMAFSIQATLEPDPNKRHIENARLAAMFQGVLGFAMALLGVLTDFLPTSYAFALVINAALMVGFAQGFARRSRIASVLCVCLQILGTLGSLTSDNAVGAITGLLIFGYFFVRGTLAIFETHSRSAHVDS